MHTSTSVALLATLDAVLAETAIFSLATRAGDIAVVRHDYLPEREAIRTRIYDCCGLVADRERDLIGDCVSCGTTAQAVSDLTALVDSEAYDALCYIPPLGGDPIALASGLTDAAASAGTFHLSTVASLLDPHQVHEDFFATHSCGERGLHAANAEASVGEALLTQVSYADVLIPHGNCPAGLELVEHLRAHSTLLATDLHQRDLTDLLFAGHHDALTAFSRIDPAVAQPWGGPSEHGTWTLDLSSARPFHPARLLENLLELASGPLIHRGRFWVPTRPHTICSWEGAGGQVSVGVVGTLPGAHPTTRLAITGCGSERERLQRAFENSLLTDVEWEGGIDAFAAMDDDLEPWLGAR